MGVLTAMARRTRDRKWMVSLATAIAIHAAVVAAGLIAYNSAARYEPPQLVLPVGWATEFDGAGEAGVTAAFQNEPPPPLDQLTDANEPTAKSVLGPIPTDAAAPDVPAPT